MAGGTRRTVVASTVFWDASALVPLCVHQAKSAAAKQLYERHQVVVWWATPVEITSAVARLLRMKSIGPLDRSSALRIVSVLSETWSVIEPSTSLRARAQELVLTYDLRAGDSLQLAAALQWCGERPQGMKFLSADTRLFEAAMLSGFDALGL